MHQRKLLLRRVKPIAVMVLAVALGCWVETNAEPIDRLVEEGVQILKEKHEIVHLQIIRQFWFATAKKINVLLRRQKPMPKSRRR